MHLEKWDVNRVSAKVAEITAEFALNPPQKGTSMTAFKDRIRDMPDEWKGLALQCITFGLDVGVDMNQMETIKFQRESILCGVGILLLIAGVILVFKFDHLTSQQDVMCCTLVALGAASFLVFLPGFLTLNGKMSPNGIFDSLSFKAGGGAAIFLLVFEVLHRSLAH